MIPGNQCKHRKTCKYRVPTGAGGKDTFCNYSYMVGDTARRCLAGECDKYERDDKKRKRGEQVRRDMIYVGRGKE